MIYINTHVLVASRRCKKMPYSFLLLHMEVVCPHSVTPLAGFGLVSMDSIWSYILNENLKLIRSGWLAVGRPSPANGGRLLAHKVLSLLCGQANLRTKKEQTENMIRTQCTTKYIRFHICNSCWYENIFTIEVRTYIYIYISNKVQMSFILFSTKTQISLWQYLCLWRAVSPQPSVDWCIINMLLR